MIGALYLLSACYYLYSAVSKSFDAACCFRSLLLSYRKTKQGHLSVRDYSFFRGHKLARQGKNNTSTCRNGKAPYFSRKQEDKSENILKAQSDELVIAGTHVSILLLIVRCISLCVVGVWRDGGRLHNQGMRALQAEFHGIIFKHFALLLVV